ncbi:MAG: hypothetical protein AB7O67_05310 [Vicinamibacterales bacterium]
MTMAITACVRRRVVSLLAGAALLLGLPSSLVAADRVFVAFGGDSIRNATRVVGEFEDLNGGTVYVRVSLHDQRRIPLGEIWIMNFDAEDAFFPAEAQGALGPQHVMAIRGRGWVAGTLLNIEGGPGSSKPDEPRIVSFRTQDGREVRVPMSEVARLYLRDFAPPSQPAQAAPAPAPVEGVQVLATQRWVSTGLTVRRGQLVTFQATGRVQLSADGDDLAGPAGSFTGRKAPGAPLPNDLAGALIARVGLGAPFGIGDQSGPIPMPAAGELFLGVNDDVLTDNRGGFVVVVK